MKTGKRPPLNCHPSAMVIRRPIAQRQSGVAMILCLLILMVMTLVGVAAMSGINLEERMAGNQKRIADAQMAAEAGVKHFYAWLNEDFELVADDSCTVDCTVRRWDNSADWMEFMPHSTNGLANYGDSGYFWIEHWDTAGDDRALRVRGEVKAPATTRRLSEYRLEVTLTEKTGKKCDLNAEARSRFPALSVMPGDFQIPACGIVAQDQIFLNGTTHLLDANLHSERVSELADDASIETSVYVSGSDSTIENGIVTAVSGADVPASWWEQGVVHEGVDPWDIQPIPDEIFDAWRDMADVVHASCGSPGSPMDLTGDQGGAMIFCEGDAYIEGRFNNVNLIVNGNLVHDGALRGDGFEDGFIDTNNFVVANGDIRFNGTTGTNRQTFDGIFWANGEFLQNGRAYVFGAVITTQGAVLGEDSMVTFDGNLEFEGLKARDVFGLNRRLAVTAWRQIW